MLMDNASLSHESLASLYLLEDVKGFGPQKFKQLHQMGVSPEQVIDEPEWLPIGGKIGENLRQGIRAIGPEQRAGALQQAETQLDRMTRYDGHVVTYDHPAYPPTVYASNNAIPILYVRGPLEPLLAQLTVACVGSRAITRPYAAALEQFALAVYSAAGVVVSGFAMGADSVGHRAVFDVPGAHTICVMPSGLDRPFPPENLHLWDHLLESGQGTFVSEFRAGRMADSLTLRKRNKLIVAFAKGVLVAQSAARGGAMNAYRFAVDQKKPLATFAADGSESTGGNEEISQQELARRGRLPLDGAQEEYARWISSLS